MSSRMKSTSSFLTHLSPTDGIDDEEIQNINKCKDRKKIESEFKLYLKKDDAKVKLLQYYKNFDDPKKNKKYGSAFAYIKSKFSSSKQKRFLALIDYHPNEEERMTAVKKYKFRYNLVVRFMGKYYFYPFQITKDELSRLHHRINKDEPHHKYFPHKKYPQVSKSKVRSKQRKKDIEDDEMILKKPSKPSIYFWTSWETVYEDYCKYIQHLFTSPSILLHKFFHDYFSIPVELKNYLELIGSKKITEWNKIAQTEGKTSIMKLQNISAKFHTCYIASRPLPQGPAKAGNLHHWALKFEGDDKLLTVEFFQQGVRSVLLLNTTDRRRVFWYWWEEQATQKGGYHRVYFTDRWRVLEKCHSNIKAKDISLLVQAWIKRDHHYSLWTNNCQHFCRDIVAAFSRNTALLLNSLFDHRNAATVIPVVPLGDSVSQLIRTYKTSKYLSDSVGNSLKLMKKNSSINGKKSSSSSRLQRRNKPNKKHSDKMSPNTSDTSNSKLTPKLTPRLTPNSPNNVTPKVSPLVEEDDEEESKEKEILINNKSIDIIMENNTQTQTSNNIDDDEKSNNINNNSNNFDKPKEDIENDKKYLSSNENLSNKTNNKKLQTVS